MSALSQRGAARALSGGAGYAHMDRFIGRLPSRFEELSSAPEVSFDLPGGGTPPGARPAGTTIAEVGRTRAEVSLVPSTSEKRYVTKHGTEAAKAAE